MNKKKYIIIFSSLIFCLIVVVVAFFVIKPYAKDKDNKKSKELLEYEEIFKLDLNKKKTEYTIKKLKNDKLSKVEIPDTIDGIPVTRLEDDSDDFSSFENVSEIVIGKNINFIGSKVEKAIFLNAKGLSKITVDEENKTFESVEGVLYSEDLTTLLCYPFSKAFNLEMGIVEIVIPNHVVTIGRYSFYGNPYIEKITFGENVKNVELKAFSKCAKLNDVTLNNKLESLASNAFSDCDIDSIVLPASMKSIGTGCFSYNLNFSKITFNSVVEIGDNSFTGTVTRHSNPGEKYTFNIYAPEAMKEIFNDFTKVKNMGIESIVSSSEKDPNTGNINTIPASGSVIFNGEKINYE